MRNREKFRAIGMMVAMMARNKAEETTTTANEVIALLPLLKDWAEGSFIVGDVRVYDSRPFRCVQAHDSTGNPTWNPVDAVSLWANYHATEKQYALPYVTPTGAHDAYMAGEWMVWTDGTVYRCLTDATVYDPEILPSAWATE